MPDNNAAIATLHRYFIWAGEMKRSFEMTAASKPQPLEWASEESLLATRTGTMTKGRNEDGTEQEVPETYSDMLRRVRNAVFHFQRDYLDNRLIAFMENEESVVGVRSLHEAFSRWFLLWLEGRHSRGQ